MDTRLYQDTDREACLAVFDTNLPDYFAAHERDKFSAFLQALPGPYFVMEHNDAVVACGGYALSSPLSARLTWGIVRREFHRQGLGRFLLLYRLRSLTRDHPAVEMVGLATTAQAAPFFESQGFRRAGTNADNLIELIKRLTVCA